MFGLGRPVDRRGEYSRPLTIKECEELMAFFELALQQTGMPQFWYALAKKKRDEVIEAYSHLMEAQ